VDSDNGLAAVAADRGDLHRVVTLIGAADATMEAAGGGWPPDERVHYDGTITKLTQSMGPAELERSRSIGRAMNRREAVEFALGAP
jgi:hypothetical protein